MGAQLLELQRRATGDLVQGDGRPCGLQRQSAPGRGVGEQTGRGQDVHLL